MTARQAACGRTAAIEGYLRRGQAELLLSFRYSRADEHYRGTEFQEEREELGNNVINTQHLFDLRLTYALSLRWNLSLSLPYFDGSWSITLPLRPEPGPRHRQHASGSGDLLLAVKAWVWDPAARPRGNLQLGLGVKCPTGNHRARDFFPDINGENIRYVPVDVSIQPGDGGWGATLEFSAFREVGRFRLFVSGLYLINPRNQNGTASIASVLVGPGAIPPHLRFNSVPDQYQGEVGVALPVAEGLVASVAVRIDGVTRSDLFGAESGFRRPGYFVAAVPGVSYAFGSQTVTLSVAITLERNRQKNAFGEPGDATFADYAVFLSWSLRF